MAQTVFVIKGIKPKKLQVDRIRLRLLNELRAEGVDQRKVLDQTTASWTGDKPKFDSLISLSGGAAQVLTGPTGNTMGIKKWNWLNEGTRVRYATMSKNWRSKTSPGSFRSGAGRGRMLFVSRRRPRPGIQARDWTGKLTKQRRQPFTNRMIQAMRQAGSEAF